MNKYIKILIIIICYIISFNSYAYKNKTAKDILSLNVSDEEKGKAIIVESDERDFGFGDVMADVTMVLYNKHGNSSSREMNNKALEVEDKTLGDKTMIIFNKPLDVKGTAFLTFSKILESDDQWLYLPALKRVKRISSKNKSGPFLGSEFAYEDISSQEVEKYNYKYIKNEPCEYIENKQSQKLQCFVVERYPNYEYSGYTKQVAFIDMEEFRLIKVDFYDRKDSFLKTLTYSDYGQYLDRYWRPGKMSVKNHQNGKSTDLIWENYQFKSGLSEKDFTKAALKRAK